MERMGKRAKTPERVVTGQRQLAREEASQFLKPSVDLHERAKITSKKERARDEPIELLGGFIAELTYTAKMS